MSRVNAKVNHADNSVGVGEASRASSGWWKSNLEGKKLSCSVVRGVVARELLCGRQECGRWRLCCISTGRCLFSGTAPGPGALYKYWTIADLALLSSGFVFRGSSMAAAAAAAALVLILQKPGCNYNDLARSCN